ncbi:MAG: 1-acyl-sn-glycerol-3-phosphate acyltransferase [Planctomycetaceae bacterium]|nr:1-acyl-sn-glycerol-3-phosphate acyltransferase [Planctomycetaceae bacterium]
MQKVFIDKPYSYVPPIRSEFMAKSLRWSGLFRRQLAKQHGVIDWECRNLDHLRESLKAGHGTMLTPNHPRTADPLVMSFVAQETPCLFYIMASWHLFHQGTLMRWILRTAGAFSVHREGLDRQAIDEAVNVLVEAKRPLLIFPEGTTSRTNDRLMALMEGPAFIARTAAKRRQEQGKVVVHPVAIRYLYQGNVEQACHKVLTSIEHKLTWRPNSQLPLVRRIITVGNALLTLKEMQYGLSHMEGKSLRQRQTQLVNHMLHPLETELLGGPRNDGIAIRIKNLRMKIFPQMIQEGLAKNERERFWQMIEDTYLAQQIDCYPENYLTEHPSVDRILETVEKFEEDLTDQARVHGKLKVVIDIDPAIEVSAKREKSAEGDPLINAIQSRLEAKLTSLQSESRLYEGK